MGSRASQTVKEIEDLRSGLDVKLDELERRLPPLARMGKKAAGLALGGGAGSAALWFVVRRARSKKKGPEEPATPEAAVPVQVNVLPKGAVGVLALGVAVWAGVRIVEARWKAERSSEERFRPAVVSPMPEGRQGAV